MHGQTLLQSWPKCNATVWSGLPLVDDGGSSGLIDFGATMVQWGPSVAWVLVVDADALKRETMKERTGALPAPATVEEFDWTSKGWTWTRTFHVSFKLPG